MLRLLLGIAQLLVVGSPVLAEVPWHGMAVGESVALETVAGRILHGRIDARTDAQRLWLTVEDGGVTITSQTPVDQVQRVEAAEQVRLPPVWQAGKEIATAVSVQASQDSVRTVSVRSLQVKAQVVNWDRDSAADGVRLWLQPLGNDQRMTPAAGLVRVELLLPEGAHPSRQQLRVQETWQQAIEATRFTSEGALVDLPFRQLDPESLAAAGPLAVLQVRFSVPGEGAFDALVTDLPLRSYSPNRDSQQQRTGTRRFAGEVH